jgi:hypothetical protein
MLDTVDTALGPFEDQPELIELAPGETSLSFPQKVYRSVTQPMSRRMQAAMAALPREHPKLGAVATVSMNGDDYTAMLDRAIERSRTVRIVLFEVCSAFTCVTACTLALSPYFVTRYPRSSATSLPP